MKQAFANFLRKFDVEGYSPMSLLNIVLAAIALGGGTFFVVSVGSYGFAGAYQASAGGFIISLLATLISFVLLIIRNLKIKSVPKIVLYTILQFALAFVALFYILIRGSVYMSRYVFGGGSNSSNSSSDSISLFPSGGKSSSNTYTDYEEQYAKANGYVDAQHANNLGFDTSPANTPGFDYTQKRD